MKRTMTLACALLFGLTAAAQTNDTALFDGHTLAGWRVLDFHAAGKVRVLPDGVLEIGRGALLSGLVFTNEPIRMNYEIELEAKRVEGTDFFCGLTVPVRSNCCTLIVGGWGGSLTGLSSIDHMDASENQTSGTMTFEQDRWYKIRLRVMPDRIEAWIDNKSIFAVETAEKTISMRPGDIEDCMPLGFATYETTAHLRNIVARPIR